MGCLCTAVALLNVALLVAVSMTIGKIYGQLIERGQEVIDAFLEVALSCQEGAKSILVLLGASILGIGHRHSLDDNANQQTEARVDAAIYRLFNSFEALLLFSWLRCSVLVKTSKRCFRYSYR